MSRLVLFAVCAAAIFQLLHAQNVTNPEYFDLVFPNLKEFPLDKPNSRQLLPRLRDKMYVVAAFLKTNWYTAQQICGFRGLSLASINSEEENSQLRAYLLENGLFGETFWLGGSSLANGNDWIWLNTGRPLVFRNFDRGEPNNVNDNEHCLSMKGTGLWNDLDCYAERYFICETQCPLSSYDVPLQK